MTTTMDPMVDVPVRKSVSVKVSQAVAFRVFTEEIDTWWPRTHHIGKAPMKKQIIQGRVGGRCYTEQTDGTDCEWGTVLVWDPPRRFVFAWQIDAQWQFVPDVEKSSEVEVRFTPEPDGSTRVALEHRHLARHAADASAIRKAVDSTGGWSGLLQLFAERAEHADQAS